MDELPPRVQLVELSLDQSPPMLRDRLADWGLDVAPCPAAAWLSDAESTPWPTVLWMGRRPIADGPSLSQQILARPRRQTLAVFDGSLADSDRVLCATCSDFISWPVHHEELRVRLTRLWPGTDADDACADVPMVGESPSMQEVRRTLAKFAVWDVPVLVLGETGTGKELAARTIHYLSGRRGRPFIPVNCGSIPPELIENELFGHQKGAYTDARAGQCGLVEQADGGTLFLDEVGTLNHRAQCALLRFMENGEYRRLGSGQTRKANVRVVAATNADLGALVESGQFRADLFFRLEVLRLDLPPLRQRLDDLPLLAEHFLRAFRAEYGQPSKRLGPGVVAWLRGRPWAGNVRELENSLRKAFLLSECGLIGVGAFLSASSSNDPVLTPPSDFRSAKAHAVASFERDYLQQLMREAGGNVTRAADLAGKERRALGKLLKKHGLDPHDFG